jgi:hypothetical protein
MKLSLKLVAVILLSQSFFGLLWSETKGLVVVIDQKHLAGVTPQTLQFLPTVLSQLNTVDMGALGEVIEIFKSTTKDQKLTTESVIKAWDDSRAQWVKTKAAKSYDNVYVAHNDDGRKDESMKTTWNQALAENDAVDYVSMVHCGDQFIKDAWQVPKSSNKLRMVYSEACQGGSGKEHFINTYRASVSAGHTGISASPLFSFNFLTHWFDGLSFQESLTRAWATTKLVAHSQSGLTLAGMIGGYKNSDEIIEGLQVKFAVSPHVDAHVFNINSGVTNTSFDNDTVREISIER